MTRVEQAPLENHGMHFVTGPHRAELYELKRASAIAIWRNLSGEDRKLYLRFLGGNLSLPSRTRRLLEALSFAKVPVSLEEIGSTGLEKIVVDSLRWEGEDGWNIPYETFDAWKTTAVAKPPKKIS